MKNYTTKTKLLFFIRKQEDYINFIVFILIHLGLILYGFLRPKEMLENQLKIYGAIKNYQNNTPISLVHITILSDENYQSSHLTEDDGTFEFYLPFNHNYKIYFEKNMYVEKFVEINSNNLDANDELGDYPMNIDVSLFKNDISIDYSWTKTNPVGKAKVDSETGEMIWDMKYSLWVKNKLNTFVAVP